MSEIRATTISNAAGTGPITMTGLAASKAYYSFNGLNSSLRSGLNFNVSSLTDQSVGNFHINLTNSMALAYSPVASSTSGSGVVNFGLNECHATTATYILHRSHRTTDDTLSDFSFCTGAIWGDLA